MKNILVFLFAICSFQVSAQTIDVSIPFREYSIKGTYLKAAKSNGTAVLIIAGSGPTDRNCNNPMVISNSYKFLAEHLASEGVSSLRYDKLGVAKSIPSMEEADFQFTDNVDVAKTVYQFLKKKKEVKRVVILGHSEGSLVGMLLAKKVKAYKYISLAGPGYPANEILKTQFESVQDSKMKSHANRMIDSLKAGHQISVYNPQLASLFRPSMNNYLINWFKFDPRVEIAKLKMPVMILQGDNDIQVSTDNAQQLANANPKAKTIILKEISHILKKAPREFQANYKTYNSPDTDIDYGVKKEITDFVLE